MLIYRIGCLGSSPVDTASFLIITFYSRIGNCFFKNHYNIEQEKVREEMKKHLLDMMQQAEFNRENSQKSGIEEKNPEVLDELQKLKKNFR